MKYSCVRFSVIFLMLFISIGASSQMITTFAGNGTFGFAGDGSPATNCSMHYPTSVAADASGNIFIADPPNNRVRVVNSSGIISLFAGTGAIGYMGDGGQATAAKLNLGTYADGSSGVTVDASGNLFIADAWNNVVRKVSTSGVITTVAGDGTAGFGGDGTPATAAMLDTPAAVCLDVSGNLYIADLKNNRVRMVNTAGIITTIAGNGTPGFGGDGAAATAANLYFPHGVQIDAAGNLYVADWGNARIRKISAPGIISTVAGNGTGGYTGDGGPATVAGIGDFGGIVLDASGTLYIVGGSVVRKVSSGFITTVVGNGTPGYAGDGGPATAAELGEPWGGAFNSSGDFFIADAGNLLIRKITTLGPSALGTLHFTTGGQNVNLFPNPSQGSFTLQATLHSATEQNTLLEITDIVGQVVYKSSIASQNGGINTKIQLNGVPNGLYLLHITTEGENDVLRFVVESN